MKHLFAEKTDLRPELKIFSFLFLLLLSDISFAQIPLNGFCKLNTFNSLPGFNKLSVINFNNNSYSDLLLMNPSNNNGVIMEGITDGEFKPARRINLPFRISNLEPVFNEQNEIQFYAVSSRAQRSFGIVSFSKSGFPTTKAFYKFSSFPDKISIADVNEDGNNEFLISGSAFNGLSILYFDGIKIAEQKIVEKTSFSFANFVDINSNGFEDIAAYNLSTGAIHFYFNDGEGNFTEKRTLHLDFNPVQFKVFDLNNDSFNDFIFSSGSSIQIFSGSRSASFDKRLTIKTAYPVDDFVISDFNNDGFFDIIYASYQAGIVSSVFGRADRTFHNEFVHLKRNRIESITTYVSNSVNGIAYLTDYGEAGYISTLSSINKDFSLALSVAPSVINYIDYDGNKTDDFIFIDEYNNSLNLIIRNNRGIPDRFFSTRLFGKHKYLIVDNTRPKFKSIYCYSSDSRLIELVTFDISSGDTKREQLYAPGTVVDLKINNSDDENSSFYVAYKKGNEYFIGEFRDLTVRYSFHEILNIGNNVLDVEIIPFAVPMFSVWKNVNQKINLVNIEAIKNQFIEKRKLSIPVATAEIFSTISFFNSGADYSNFSFIKSDEKTFISFEGSAFESLISADKQFFNFRIKNKNHLSFNGAKDVFLYDDVQKSVRKIEFSGSRKQLKVKEIFRNIDAHDFTIMNLDFINEHLIYTNKTNGSISIKRLQ